MNDSQAITPLTPEQEQKVYAPNQEWSESFALKVAVQDFQSAQTYRSANHDWRWREHMLLYEAWTQQKFWEGSRIPRSSIPIYLCFAQIESMVPRIVSAIFSDDPWFEAEPEPGTKQEESRAIRNLILMQMDQTQVREIVRRWIKSGLIYGNGIMQLDWTQMQTQKSRYVPTMRPQMRTIGDMTTGTSRQINVGFQRVLEKRGYTEMTNRPELSNVLIYDFYIDPNCPTPNPQDARFCYTRKLPTVDEMDALRGHEEWTIPPKSMLIQLAHDKPASQGDVTASAVETARSGRVNREIDSTVDPGGKRMELICRWSEDRCVYVLNQEIVAYNQTNPYGFMPFYDFAYADLPGRFYALGMCDVLEGEQRFRTSLRNARVDEIALNIHRPMIKRRGVTTSPSQMRAKPGQVLEANDPMTDFVFPNPPNILQSSYIEDQYSQAEAQKTTGMTDMVASGMSQSGGNSALRTATGVGASVNAGSSRIQYLVENAEDTGIEPMLRDVYLMNQLYPPINGIDVPGQEGQPEQHLGPEVIVNSGVKFKMRASAKMRSQQQLMQTLPLVLQTLGNPALMQQLAATGETVNWNELMEMVLDMTGYRNREGLIRKLTEQEKQMMNAPPQQEQTKMKMQQERIASKEKTDQAKIDATAENLDQKGAMELAKAALQGSIRMMSDEAGQAVKKLLRYNKDTDDIEED